jgi:hypothetical protein
MIIPPTSVHLTGELITPKLHKLIDEKIKLFEKKGLKNAGMAEIVGVLMDYNLTTPKWQCGGYCDAINKEIAIIQEKKEIIITRKNIKLTRAQYEKSIVFHELGHAFQYELEMFEKERRILSERVHVEWQAESIAYKLYNRLYGHAPHQLFGTYFSRDDLIWLNEWYGNRIENDLNL